MKTAKKPKTPPLSDAEEAKIQAGIAQDPDNPEWTEEDFRRARPAREVLPPELYAALVSESRERKKPDPKAWLEPVRLDSDVIEKFRSTGPGWERRINDVLRKAAGLRKSR